MKERTKDNEKEKKKSKHCSLCLGNCIIRKFTLVSGLADPSKTPCRVIKRIIPNVKTSVQKVPNTQRQNKKV